MQDILLLLLSYRFMNPFSCCQAALVFEEKEEQV